MIEVAGLELTYPRADAPTVRGIDFEVAQGEIFGFLGPSGAGKSTTQKVLIGLLAGYRGRARVMGREVRDWGPGYYEHIGVSFELPNHFARLTARENLQHFASLYAGDVLDPLEVLGWVGLAEHADKRVSDFSKGMKVRLGVARAVQHRPSLLFLDEPTSGLDPVNARIVKDLALRLRDEGATIFLTTHDMTVADQLCDRVAFITDGSLDVVDAPASLKRAHGRRVVRLTVADDGGPKELEFPLDGLADDAGFLETLRTDRVEAIHSQETTLENVFIEVTGQELQG